MSTDKTVKCDNCNADITYTTNSIDYRLHLCDDIMPSKGGTVTAMMLYPSLKDGPKDFCGLGCLKAWAFKQ